MGVAGVSPFGRLPKPVEESGAGGCGEVHRVGGGSGERPRVERLGRRLWWSREAAGRCRVAAAVSGRRSACSEGRGRARPQGRDGAEASGLHGREVDERGVRRRKEGERGGRGRGPHRRLQGHMGVEARGRPVGRRTGTIDGDGEAVRVAGDECGRATGSRARRRNGGLGSGRRGGEEARGFSEVVVATGDAVVAATAAIRGRGEAAAAGSSPPRSRSRGEGSEHGGGRVGSGEWVRGLGFPGVGIREASWARVELGLSAGGDGAGRLGRLAQLARGFLSFFLFVFLFCFILVTFYFSFVKCQMST